MFQETTATKKIQKLTKRIRGVSGGCLGVGTKVVMYDLSLKKVEEVVVGDKLMGPDGKPRMVKRLYTGISDLYLIRQTKGINYIVNDKHILVLEDQGQDIRQRLGGKRVYTGRVHVKGLHKITAEDFYRGSWKSTTRRFKGIKSGVELPKRDVDLDPYFLGLWLGDGTERNAYITNVDPEVLRYLYNDIPKMYDVEVKRYDRVTTAIVKKQGKYNDIIRRLKGYSLISNKHIPNDFLHNSRSVRLKLLAGLIDSDGCLSRDSKTGRPKGYVIVQKRKRLAEDILTLTRSLGYYSNIIQRESRMKRVDGTVYSCTTYTVSFTMQDYTELPVKVNRKYYNFVNEKRNCLRSTIDLEPLGAGKYYGFELDGDHLFLLEDFTITHNTSASKTVSILIWLIGYAQSTTNELISVVSETLPHLKRGAIRDFLNIMQEHNYFDDSRWNKTDFIYTFETGSKIEFFSADQPSKVRGPRRDVLFINEANNVPFETYTQLEVRTRKIIWLDWNPVSEFWWYTEVVPNFPHDFLTLTYKDNEALEPSVVQSIEQRKNNRNWWLVYGEGVLGEAEGRIYKDWQLIDDIPHEARLERYGQDFGYTNDPTAVVAVYYFNGGLILDEILYQKGMLNKQIADVLKNVPQAMVMADSAEPKSIDEIRLYGINIQPAQKGAGSVNQGIQYVQQQRISVTKRSVNLIKEYRNYLWQTDKDGRIINAPTQGMDHALDAVRYAVESLKPNTTDELPPDDTILFQGGYY